MIAFHSPSRQSTRSSLDCGKVLFLLVLSGCRTLAFAEAWPVGVGRLQPQYPSKEFGVSSSSSSMRPMPTAALHTLRGGSTRLQASTGGQSQQHHKQRGSSSSSSERRTVHLRSNKPFDDGTKTPHTTSLDAATVATLPPRPETHAGRRLMEALQNLDIGLLLGLAYGLTDLCCRVPIVLMPTIAAEQARIMGPYFSRAGFVASAASIAFLGGGIGKLVNGGVCQAIGAKTSLTVYMAAIGIFSLLLSLNQSTALFGPLLAGMEFGMSMRWPACLVIFEKYCRGDSAKIAAAVTKLSLMSTAGNILSKVLGSALLSATGSWQLVLRLGAVMALAGASIAWFLLEDQEQAERRRQRQNPKTSVVNSVRKSFAQVLGTRFFWMVSLAHLPAFVAVACDKLLGSFYVHASGLPESVCGGLTTACTVGLVHGLSRGNAFYKLKSKRKELAYVRNNYAAAVVSLLGLALCGGPWMAQLIPSKLAMAGILAALSFTMNSCVAFQYYQVPGIAMSQFAKNIPIFLALLDGVGYFGAGPIFGAASQLISQLRYGWTLTWTLMGLLLAAGGHLMVRTLDPILEPEGAQQKKRS
mmetsp:Transcript_9196/g.19810  ORF Transcript_9196/g.19810 Transcript_9196/m.19810 type:complete len:584 (+) Transcript_9196:238-1989(+)